MVSLALGACAIEPDQSAPAPSSPERTVPPDVSRADAGHPGADAAPDDDPCGGAYGDTCSPIEYCAFDEPSCVDPEATGTCQPRPDICFELFDPVCGCDGATYPSPCHARMAGTDVATEGPCPTDDPDDCPPDDGEPPCTADTDCDPFEECTDGQCVPVTKS